MPQALAIHLNCIFVDMYCRFKNVVHNVDPGETPSTPRLTRIQTTYTFLNIANISK